MKLFCLILPLFLSFSTFASDVTGTVADDNGNPLPFATILVKGTSLGATANSAGYYSIKLSVGNYILEAHYIGYTTVEKQILVGDENVQVNFRLKIQQLELPEIIVTTTGEDPAYRIIRNAIKMRPFYDNQVKSFTADVYIKGLGKMLKMPDKILGQKIPEENRDDMLLDSTGKGIVYLAESLTHVSVQEPDKIKMEVISNRTSGGGFGFDFPVFISFYKNKIALFSNTIGKRGFVSPIADNALNFYRYKLLGRFTEGGNLVNTIQVIPKHRFEPVFRGIINITENDWRIFSLQLSLTKESQLEIIDSIAVSQIHTPQSGGIWRVKNQLIHIHFDQFGIEMAGDFVNIYNNYDLNPVFPKGFFDKVVIRYDTAANKRPEAYWDTVRPVPLEAEEIKDFKVKDSLKVVRDSTWRNPDSLRKYFGKNTLKDFLVNDAVWRFRSGKRSNVIRMQGLLDGLQYNTVEGASINPSITFSTNPVGKKYILRAITDFRYGFHNKHFNPWGGITFSKIPKFGTFDFYNNFNFYVAGGKRVSQFFKMSPLPPAASSISTLFYGWNEMKLYENYFFKTGYKRAWDNGTKFTIEGIWEDRLPLDNTTDYIFRGKHKDRITPNFPEEVLDQQFTRHQATVIHASLSIQPGQTYIQYPNMLQSLGSDYPVFTIHYFKGIKRLFGSEENFDRWELNANGEKNMHLAGRLKYLVGIGGFLNKKQVFVQDYKHFYGTQWHVADEYAKAFQNTTLYQYSNASSFYSEVHLEHHSDGLITNKIPLLRKWNWNLVEGVNALFVHPDQKHLEIFAGLENIFKVFRIDALMTMRNGFKPVFSYRIGFGGLIGDALNAQAFDQKKKIIDPW